MTAVVVTLWRCSQCGKWSHATRRPRHHQRFVAADGLTRPAEDTILDETDPVYGYEGDIDREAGWIVRCGPFDEWTARLVPS